MHQRPDNWKQESEWPAFHGGDTFIVHRWNNWYHMDTCISNAARKVPHHTCRQYRNIWRKDKWVGRCIYEHTTDSTEITTASSIGQKFDNWITARYWIVKKHS